MKALFTVLIITLSATFSTSGYAFPELPFCPAGGPPGWMNYFNYKRDQNNWRHYSQYAAPTYYQPAYSPAYGRPYNYSNKPYGNNPYNNRQPYRHPGNIPYGNAR